MFFFGCEEEETLITYACTSDGCVEDAAGLYASLESCESECCEMCIYTATLDSYWWNDVDWELLGFADADAYAASLTEAFTDAEYCGDELQDIKDAWDDLDWDELGDMDGDG